MWSTTDANKSRSALDSRSRLALRPQPVARILVRFAPDAPRSHAPTLHRTPSLGSPQSPQQSIPTEQLFLEMRVGATQSLSNLAAQQVGLLAYERDEMIIINLLQATEGDVRISGNSLTTWQIPIASLAPLEKKELLLRGVQHGLQFPVHATLLLVPLQPPSHIRRKRQMLWDSHGFVVPALFEKQYLAWERSQTVAIKSKLADTPLRDWEERRLTRARDADGFPLRTELEDSTLLRRGMPDFLRSQVWQELLGADLVAEARPDTHYEELLRQAYQTGDTGDSRCHKDIAQDMPRTFPDHPFLCPVAGRQMLERVLLAYSLQNPIVGYCQAMNFLCAFLLLYMDERSAFWALSRVVEDRMAGYYKKGMVMVQVDQMLLAMLVEELEPQLHQHLTVLDISLATITTRWFMCLFIGVVPAETAARIWDCFMQDGRDVLFRATFGLLKLHMAEILAADTFEDVFQTLKNAPIGTFDANTLMKLAYEDDTVVILMRELRASKEDSLIEEINSRPHAAPLHIHVDSILEIGEISRMRSLDSDGSQTQSNTDDSDDDTSSCSSSSSGDAGDMLMSGSTAVIEGCAGILTDATSGAAELAEQMVGRSLKDKADLTPAERRSVEQVLFPFEIETYELKYRSLVADGDECISAAAFKRALGEHSNGIADQVFRVFDSDGDGYLSMLEYIQTMNMLERGDVQQQAAIAADLLDPLQTGSVARIDLVQLTYQQYSALAVRNNSSEEQETADASVLDAINTLVNDMFGLVGAAETMSKQQFMQVYVANNDALNQVAHPGGIGSLYDRADRLKMMNDELCKAQEEMLRVPRSQRAALKQRIEKLDSTCRQLNDYHRNH